MTLLLFDGIENVLTMPKPFVNYAGNSSSMQPGRDGSTNGAYRGGGTSGFNNSIVTLPSAAATLIMGAGVQFRANGTGRINFYNEVGVLQCCLFTNGTTGRYEFWLGNPGTTLLGQSAVGVVMTAATWVHIQVKLVLHNTAGSVEVRLNNATIITLSGVATATAPFNAGSFAFQGGVGGGSTNGVQFDDVWACDGVDATATQGQPNNDFLGDLKVVALAPTGVGDSTQWTASTGANWNTLEENPPVNTDYVYNSGSDSGERDLYTMTDLPALAGAVYALDSRVLATKMDVGQAGIKQIIKEASVVTMLSSSNLGLTTDVFCADLITKRPSDGTPLSVVDINGMQLGVEVV